MIPKQEIKAVNLAQIFDAENAEPARTPVVLLKADWASREATESPARTRLRTHYLKQLLGADYWHR
ncbi:MAG TPA: hypothetical protein VGV18_09015 [Verrucomicrobiae bacterium]|nr:hypothetical protein [Verrucomicrobiae bacterium]